MTNNEKLILEALEIVSNDERKIGAYARHDARTAFGIPKEHIMKQLGGSLAQTIVPRIFNEDFTVQENDMDTFIQFRSDAVFLSRDEADRIIRILNKLYRELELMRNRNRMEMMHPIEDD